MLHCSRDMHAFSKELLPNVVYFNGSKYRCSNYAIDFCLCAFVPKGDKDTLSCYV